MSKLQPVRGTHDLLPEILQIHKHIVMQARELGSIYGFDEIETPIFEFTEIFKRTLGDTSDVVNKEMYTFEDRGGDSVTLRPEFTAGIVRAFISNGLQQHLPLKLFSVGPVFRYERPQKGRLRQFHQVNYEWLGNSDPLADVELIALAHQLLVTLGIANNVRLELNSLGDTESRDAYRKALVEFLTPHKNDLSEDSQKRLDKNPLRILDSKDEGDKAIIKGAPAMLDYLNDSSKTFFDQVKAGLDAIGINYNINPGIVRGLDYYAHTVFEFIADSEALGVQNTLIAGGRYDGLAKQMGGPDTPAVGFAAGIERLALLAEVPGAEIDTVAVIPVSDEEITEALKLTNQLRQSQIASHLLTGGNLKKKMQRADKLAANTAIIVGADELTQNKVTIKNLTTGEQQQVDLSALISEITSLQS